MAKGFLEGAGPTMESPAPGDDAAAAFLLLVLRSTDSVTPSFNTRDEPSKSAASRPSAESKWAKANVLPGM